MNRMIQFIVVSLFNSVGLRSSWHMTTHRTQIFDPESQKSLLCISWPQSIQLQGLSDNQLLNSHSASVIVRCEIGQLTAGPES